MSGSSAGISSLLLGGDRDESQLVFALVVAATALPAKEQREAFGLAFLYVDKYTPELRRRCCLVPDAESAASSESADTSVSPVLSSL